MPATPPNEEQMFPSYEGQNVSSVRLAGQPDLDPSQFTSIMAQKPGEPFSAKNVEQTAEALRATGKFKQVRIDVEPEANGVRVTYVLEPAVWYGIFQFPGSGHFAYSQLIQASNYPVQRPYDAQEIETDRRSLQAFFQQEGYFEAQVQTQLKVDTDHDIANVDFKVTLARKAKFGQAVTQGGTSAQDAELDHKLTTLCARLRGSAVRPGKAFHRSTLERATRYLQSTLEKQGYLGAQVKLLGAEYDPSTHRAEIRFQINPGVKTHVKITGAHLWSWDKKDLLPVYQGIGVDQESVQEGRQALISYFQGKGYFNVKVSADLTSNPSGDTILYQIVKEKKHKVAAVHVAGNTTIPDSKLMPSVAVQKKHLFSPGKFSNELVRTSVKNLTAIYNADGFSDAKVTDSVTTDDEGNIHVAFRVVEGPRNVVNAIWIEGANTFPQSQFAPHGLKVRPGEPYSQAHVEEDRTEILANYLKAGYLNAGFRETATEVSAQDPHHINVVYHIHEGPRVFTGDVITLGRMHTNPRLVALDTMAIKPDKPLTESDLLTAGSSLYQQTGVFDWAQVDPKRQITTQTKEDVLVKVHEGRRNEFQYGFGFEVIRRGGSIPSGTAALPNLPPVGLPANFKTAESTFYGPRGTAQYTLNNIRGKGESLSLTAFAGRLDQRAGFYYIDPYFRWSQWKATTSATFERNEENPIFSSQIETGTLEFQRPVRKSKTRAVALRYSYNRTDLTRVLLAQLVPADNDHIKLSMLSGQFTLDTRDDPLNAHHGVFDTAEIDFDSSKLGSNVDYAKFTGQAAYYKEKLHHIVWANSIRLGLAEPFNNSFVPLSEEFFTGGGNSLRGVPLDSAGLQRTIYICPDGTNSCGDKYPFPSGGNELLILNSEARVPLSSLMKNLGFVVFYDGGSVFPQVGFHVPSQYNTSFTSLYSNSVGGGIRYSTPVGPIRFDLGYDLNPIPNTQPAQHYGLQYFIGIGQAF